MSNIREVVNGSQLLAHISKNVSVTGFVVEKAPNGLWFEMRTADNQIVRVTMKRPIDSQLEGYVEVHGISSGKGITADDYITFTNEKFDAKAHNTLCGLLNTIPHLWSIS